MKMRGKFVLGLVAVLCWIFIFNSRAYAQSPVTTRIGGQDRYDTSVEVSKSNFGSSNYVILASGEDFADALCSAPLARKYKAPILLTEKNQLRSNVISEIKRLGAKSAFIIGGTGAVSSNVENQLQSINVTSNRIWGNTRYDTSVKIAENIGSANGIVIASGENFPDALSIASIAASKQMPIVLTQMNNIPDSAKNFLDGNKGKNGYIIGGQGAVSSSIENYLGNYKRLGGENRFATNTAVINEFSNSGDISMSTVYIASGSSFPDALSASAAAAQTSSPVIISNNGTTQQTLLKSNISFVSTIKVIGGTGAVSDAEVQMLITGKATTGKSVTVVLDAGHGGYDPGAVGPGGSYEKNDTLAITLKVGQILKNNGINVIYTRTSDNVSWPSDVAQDLQKRCDISNEAGADYFVAIHMNSADSSSAGGTETYYYSPSSNGAELAQYIQTELVKAIGLSDRGVKTANYYVLKNTDAPAALVEVGFISNPSEEKLLQDSSFQNKAAQGIANGIMKKINQDN